MPRKLGKDWTMVNCIIPKTVKTELKRKCEKDKISVNSFLKACIMSYLYPSRISDFEDVITFLSYDKKRKKKKKVAEGYNNNTSPREGIIKEILE